MTKREKKKGVFWGKALRNWGFFSKSTIVSGKKEKGILVSKYITCPACECPNSSPMEITKS